MLGRPGLNTAAGSELQFLLCSCDELSTVDTAHPRCLAASHSHHMDILLLYRNVAGSKGFGGGRHRIDNWPKLLHHAGFLLENGQNMHGRHIADARLHYQTISVLPYTIPLYRHHTARKHANITRPSHCYGRTFTWWLAVLKFIFSSSVMWMWSSELARLRGPDNKSNMKFAMNPNVPTKLDCALSRAVVWEAQSGVTIPSLQSPTLLLLPL